MSQARDVAAVLGAALPGASDAAIDRMAGLAHARRYAAGQLVFRKGDAGNALLVVAEGRIVLSSLSPEGREVILRIADRGEAIGEIGVLDGGPRTADATALRETRAFALLRGDLVRLLESEPSAARALLLLVCGRVRQTTGFVEDAVFETLEARLLHSVQTLAGRYGCRNGTGFRIEHGLSQQALADSIGLSRVSVNKQLNAWRARGLVDFGRGVLVVHDRAWLAGLRSSSRPGGM